MHQQKWAYVVPLVCTRAWPFQYGVSFHQVSISNTACSLLPVNESILTVARHCRDSDLSVVNLKQVILEKFKALHHVPVWKSERPEAIRGNSDLRIYKVYPVSLTQREALYTWNFGGDKGLRNLLKKEPCLKLEVIFV